MTDREKLVLILLLRDGPISTWDMAVRLGYRPVGTLGRASESAYEATRRALRSLCLLGAAHHPYNSWSITEPGRIQAGLLMADDPGLRRVYDREQS